MEFERCGSSITLRYYYPPLIEALHGDGEKQIDAAWQKEAFKPENFMSRRDCKALDEAKKAQYIELLATCSEIASVALYYLPNALEPR